MSDCDRGICCRVFCRCDLCRGNWLFGAMWESTVAEEYQMQISNRMLTTILFLASLQVVDFQLVAATAAYDLVVVDADTNLPIKGKDFLFSEWYAYNLEQKEGHDQSRCFSFRIRVKRNLQGEIESAIYGKIYGDARFLYRGDDYAADRWSRKVDGLSFLYYLNPTPNDRNLEWDRKNNLCPNPENLGNKLMP